MLAVDMAAAERRIHSALQAHVSQLRQQLEAEQRQQLTADIKQQVPFHIQRTCAKVGCLVDVLYTIAAHWTDEWIDWVVQMYKDFVNLHSRVISLHRLDSTLLTMLPVHCS